MNYLSTAGVAAAMLISPLASAEKLFSDSSISLLYSDQYEAFGPDERTDTYVTFENVTAHDWGGTFLFVDSNHGRGSADGDDDLYGEFSPALSLGWLSGVNLQRGPMKDVALAGTYEFGGGNDATNILTGISFAWDVPGTQYFNSTFYYVNNSEIADDLQLTLTWGAPFELGASRFLFDGYIDYSSAASDHDAEFHFNPQFKLDLGHYRGHPGVLYAGIEYSYWENKYGLADNVMDTESAVSALVKFHF
ncbi:outer membrane protein OmpK [Halovibrio sp. HP20-50]|uniref:outer membrane protein OmpK n=1 Tax=Halovibrio sp. HP20-59 TaxID=3080275 RepID=UPI00294B79D2|nr:outer membrane protein OmpK [Halovibrio sp. HP20-59]MEA2117881.1 outer membrane protein OmpK [Halovibrio sp. HP20-59]